jgi:ADP-heptose:LPS heptosyltransferase
MLDNDINSTLLSRDIKRIVVLRALVVGDLLCAVPAFRALRAAFPTAKIALIGLPWAQEFVQRFSRYFDEFIEFPGYPGLPERNFNATEFPHFIEGVRSERFDLALQMQGSGSYVNGLMELFEAGLLAGFHPVGENPPVGIFAPYPEGTHEIRRNLQVIELLGLPLQGEHLEWPLANEDFQALDAIPEAAELALNPYVCVHAGSRYLSRRWHPERFAQVADAIQEMGHRIVLTGSAGEAELVAHVESLMQSPALNLAGKTSLPALGALLSRAGLLITNDTGVSHLAAALRLRSVVIVTGSDPARWAPLNGEFHRLALQPIHCRPCPDPVCPFAMECADSVSADQVIRLAFEQLSRSGIRVHSLV